MQVQHNSSIHVHLHPRSCTHACMHICVRGWLRAWPCAWTSVCMVAYVDGCICGLYDCVHTQLDSIFFFSKYDIEEPWKLLILTLCAHATMYAVIHILSHTHTQITMHVDLHSYGHTRSNAPMQINIHARVRLSGWRYTWIKLLWIDR